LKRILINVCVPLTGSFAAGQGHAGRWCQDGYGNQSRSPRPMVPQSAEKAFAVCRRRTWRLASIPLALDQAYRDGRIRRGDKVLMHAVGAGVTWGALAMQA
jgi:hypothetical protein